MSKFNEASVVKESKILHNSDFNPKKPIAEFRDVFYETLEDETNLFQHRCQTIEAGAKY